MPVLVNQPKASERKDWNHIVGVADSLGLFQQNFRET